MNILKTILCWAVQCTWGILQTIVGAVMYLIILAMGGERKHEGHTLILLYDDDWGAVTIGPFCIASSSSSETTYKHEHGHSIQSLILGPLWFFVIGIPSIIHAWLWDKSGSYYDFYTEKWADKLGGVSRD